MRTGLLFALLLAACSDPGRRAPDAPIDSPAGSGAAAWGETQASPRDHGLEVGVLVASMFVVVGPASMRRRKSS